MNLDPTKIPREAVIKGVIILVVVISLFFAIRKVIKTIKGDSNQKNLDAEIQANQLSYPLNQYFSLADQVDGAFTYLTTDETTIYNVMKKMNTLSDVLQLNKAFGIRKFYGFIGDASLAVFLQKGMDKDEIEQVNKILKANNINFSF